MDEIERNQLAESSLKLFFGSFPIGNILNEVLFNYRAQVKQARINKFADLLKEYFESTDEAEVNFDQLKSEDFGDIFESIIRRVALNKSDKKLIRFKEILLNHLNCETEYSDQTENFLDVVSRLNESQISILIFHNKLTINLHEINGLLPKLRSDISENKIMLEKEKELLRKGRANYSSKYEKIITQKEQELSDSESLLKDYKKFREAEFYKLNQKQYSVLIQDLISKGLLYDAGIGSMDFRAFEILGITEYGQEFLNFIKAKEN